MSVQYIFTTPFKGSDLKKDLNYNIDYNEDHTLAVISTPDNKNWVQVEINNQTNYAEDNDLYISELVSRGESGNIIEEISKKYKSYFMTDNELEEFLHEQQDLFEKKAKETTEKFGIEFDE